MPMAPEGSALHIDQALTGVSVAYFQDSSDFIADSIFPSLPVDKRSDLYRKYSKSDWRRSDAEERAPGTESAGIGWSTDTDNYYAKVYSVHVDIDDQTRANADNNWNLDADATRLVTNHLLLQKDQLWCDTYFKSSVWAVEYDGVSASPTGTDFLQFDQDGSDPLQTFTGWRTKFRLSVGRQSNFCVMGADVYDTLINHPAILDRIKYTQEGVITEELLARYLNVGRLKVAYSSEATGPRIDDAKAQDAAATYSFVADTKGILFGFAPSKPSLLTPSAGYTFNWKGYGAGNKQGLTMSQFRMKHLKSDRIEGEAAYVMKLVSTDCGVWVNGAVA